MISDPLLEKMKTPSIQKGQSMETSESPARAPKTKRRPPARSAKILTVGLSTTAMLGMTTGYAFADLAQKTEELPVTPVTPQAPVSPVIAQQIPPSQTVVAPQAGAPSASAKKAPAVPATAQQTPAAPQGAQNAPQREVVIDVPVAGNGNSSWNNQKSSGSN